MVYYRVHFILEDIGAETRGGVYVFGGPSSSTLGKGS